MNKKEKILLNIIETNKLQKVELSLVSEFKSD